MIPPPFCGPPAAHPQEIVTASLHDSTVNLWAPPRGGARKAGGMTHRWLVGGVVGLLLLAGCAARPTATATITGTTPGSKLSGTARFAQTVDGVHVIIMIANAPPGKHGLHIHEHGDCGESGKAAGGHFNPDHVSHGFLPKDGFAHAHAGDLGNIEIGPNGSGRLELVIPGLALTGPGKYAIGGRAVILHEKADDFGQPTGNAGGRIGCGVIPQLNE